MADTTIRLVCVGSGYDSKGKVHSWFKQVKVDEPTDKPYLDDEMRAWPKVSGTPGVIYEFTAVDWDVTPGTIRPSTKRPVDEWPVREDRLRWQQEARAVRVQRDQRRVEDKLESSARVELSGLRATYLDLPRSHRAAFLASIIQQVTKP